jgi:hypothetical protein
MLKNTERPQINNLMLYLKLLEKQEQIKSKTSRRREIIKIWARINTIQIKKTHTNKQQNKELVL